MKWFGTFLFAALLQLNIPAADLQNENWGPATNHIQMSIRLVGGMDKIQAGKAVRIRIRFKNNCTNETFNGYYALGVGLDRGMNFQITNPSHKDISPKYVRSRSGFETVVVISVPPGETKEYEYDLDILCKLHLLQKFTQPGDYEIIARQDGRLNTNQPPFVVISNPLKFLVIKPDTTSD